MPNRPAKKKPAPVITERTPKVSVRGETQLVIHGKTDRILPLHYDNGALYRLSNLPNGIPSGKRLTNPRTFYGTALDYGWAMLSKEDRLTFPTVEDFAAVIPQEDSPALLEAVTNALNKASDEDPQSLGNG